jgi:carbamoyltransferase
MNVLGLSYNYHDAAACIVRDGVAVAAAEEERFSRIKHDSRFPRQAVAFCLRAAGLTSRDLDAVAFYEKPARKLERILQVGKRHAPASAANVVAQFSSHIAGGFDVEPQLREQMGFEGDVYFCAHHLSHAASAFYASPYEAAAILTVDGVGEWATVAQFRGRGRVIEKRREIRYPHSIGLLYSTLTAFLGFRANDDEYKVMGLAAYGKPRFRAQFEELVTLHRDGSFSLALPYFAFMYARERMHSPLLESLLGPPRAPHESVSERHRDIAATLQAVTEDILVALARACRDDGARHLCLAGGVAQNCVANTKILQRAGFSGLFIQPAPGDSGAAMGAALWASHQVLGQARSPARHQTCLGPEFGEAEMLAALQASRVAFRRLPEAERCRQVAALIAQDFIIGWFQGRMEFGPRALRAGGDGGGGAALFRSGRRKPLHAADAASDAGPGSGNSGRHACRWHRAGANRLPRGQPAIPSIDHRIRRDFRHADLGQHFVQRARRADRLHAGRRCEVLSGNRHRLPGDRPVSGVEGAAWRITPKMRTGARPCARPRRWWRRAIRRRPGWRW